MSETTITIAVPVQRDSHDEWRKMNALCAPASDRRRQIITAHFNEMSNRFLREFEQSLCGQEVKIFLEAHPKK